MVDHGRLIKASIREVRDRHLEQFVALADRIDTRRD
jgi:hypothetical protein